MQDIPSIDDIGTEPEYATDLVNVAVAALNYAAHALDLAAHRGGSLLAVRVKPVREEVLRVLMSFEQYDLIFPFED